MIKQSYRIWFSQRNGSTLLSLALERTGVAGKPKELFNIAEDETMCSHYSVDSFDELRETLWSHGSTSNGIMAVKNCLYTSHYAKIVSELKELKQKSGATGIDNHMIWEELFPNCKHIFMTRRNKLRQSVSWWKAINDGVWHRKKAEETADENDLVDKYNANALNRLLLETVLRECSIQDYFSKYNIKPFTIVYEDFVMDYELTIRRVLDFIDIDHSAMQIEAPPLFKTATDFSEAWVYQFRGDLQEGWDKVIW